MDVERLTGKYSGVRISYDVLAAHHRQGGIAAAIADALIRAVAAIGTAERELGRIVAAIDHATATVARTITAGPGERVPSAATATPVPSAIHRAEVVPPAARRMPQSTVAGQPVTAATCANSTSRAAPCSRGRLVGDQGLVAPRRPLHPL